VDQNCKDEFPCEVQAIWMQRRCSLVREEGSVPAVVSAPGVFPTLLPEHTHPVPVEPARPAIEMDRFTNESLPEAEQVIKVAEKATLRQLNLQLRALELENKKRSFHDLPSNTCYVSESDLLTVERWVLFDAPKLYDGILKFFTAFTSTRANATIKVEIRRLVERQLPHVIEAVLRHRYDELEHKYACRAADDLMQELDRKKTLALHGPRVAREVEHKTRMYETNVPVWVKARESVLSQVFRRPSQPDAAGNEGYEASP
jgi:hypothetical protein